MDFHTAIVVDIYYR